MLQVGRIVYGTTAEGPGNRSAIWVQGCSIRCPGCINPQLFSRTGGRAEDPALIVADALASGTEGLTLLGGEPFDQPDALADLAELAQRSGLGVICFTGYSREELTERGISTDRMLKAIDLLVDGPYVAELTEQTRSLVGSTNQRFIHLTTRYADFDPTVHRNRVDVRIGSDGLIEVAGFLDTVGLEALASVAGATRRRRPLPIVGGPAWSDTMLRGGSEDELSPPL
jgi:anaerobic ribonucleoside-triphosphate reductase activating protein